MPIAINLELKYCLSFYPLIKYREERGKNSWDSNLGPLESKADSLPLEPSP